MSDILPEQTQSQKFNNRWYDQREITSRAMVLFEEFPTSIQSVIAGGVVTLADQEFEANKLMRSYKTLGKDKVLALHKSQKKQRYLDRDHTVHKAMTYLFILSEDSQDFMAQKIIEMMEFISQYVQTCQTFEEQPSEEQVMHVANTYIKEGAEGADAFVKKMKEFMAMQIETRKRPPRRGFSDGKVGLSNDDKGMKIRGDVSLD